jgi:hypothetical protein
VKRLVIAKRTVEVGKVRKAFMTDQELIDSCCSKESSAKVSSSSGHAITYINVVFPAPAKDPTDISSFLAKTLPGGKRLVPLALEVRWTY